MFNINKLRSIVILRNYSNINQIVNYKSNIRKFNTTTQHNKGDKMASNASTSMGNSPSSGSSTRTNRLINEKSPYLLQHATNPVDWYPWCDEAIQKAKNENKLIFLSVGYSTCHWCHVMEKESFENEEVAKYMNENFINIKVDREERPDIDKIYMMFVVLITESGGWPMSVWLTPDLAPITGGTYFPPQDRWGMPGFLTVLKKLAHRWEQNGPELLQSGKDVIKTLQKSVEEKQEPDEKLSNEDMFKKAVMIFKNNFDEDYGGWGAAPKFPQVSKLNFLFHAHFKQPNSQIAELVLITLKKIANGGIHDHIFGGFARYAVDQKWHIPHFEKMLYDQAQLLVAYSNAYRLTRDKFYLDICDKIVKYSCSDLQHPKGGFYSGEDADSLPTHDDKDKIEGAFYAWTYSEVEDAFQENSDLFASIDTRNTPFAVYKHYYNIKKDGNVEPHTDPHGHLINKNIFFVEESIEETAEYFQLQISDVDNIIKIGNDVLHKIRSKRPRPHLDTKILCAWNGLMLSGLSKLAACVEDNEKKAEYLLLAKKLTNFIRENLYDADKKILFRSCYGEGVDVDDTTNMSEPIEGFLDDYTFFIKGLLDYYVATLDIDVLHWAYELQNTQDKLFWDDDNGGYFFSQANSPNVIVRLKDDHDGAEPCGNSMAVHNLMLLNSYYEESHFKDRAKKVIDYFSGTNVFGYVLPHMMSGLLLYDGGIELLIVVGPNSIESRKLFDVTKKFFLPGLVPVLVEVDNPDSLTRKSAKQFKMVKNLPTVYICHNFVCQLPITDKDELEQMLTEKYVYQCDI